MLRTGGQAIAPVLVRYLSTLFEKRGQNPGGASAGTPHGAQGLATTFLILLVPLAAAGLVLLLLGRRTYARDVATAAASERTLAGVPHVQPDDPVHDPAAGEER